MNRSTMAGAFASSSGRSSWKTFVLEAHAAGDPYALLSAVFGDRNVSATDDVHLHQVDGRVDLVVDHLDDRFWSVHTTAPASEAEPFLKDVVESWRELDWMWLPSDHLREVWPGARPEWIASDFAGRRLAPHADDLADFRLRVRGGAAERVLRLVESDFGQVVSLSSVLINATDGEWGWVAEAISRDGRFVARGDDFGFHQAIVQRVVGRYRGLVEAVELSALRWVELPEGGARLEGAPLVLRFGERIVDLPVFLDRLFSAREPFRLWGIPEMTEDGVAEVEAVDLHVGQQLRFDIAPDWMRVYLFEGGCGNTVARLVSNLQHHLDGKLQILHPGLDATLRVSTTA